MAPAYKLTYFNIRGAAESIRFILSYGGIEFEDIRIEREQWPQIKPTTPFGQVPILEHNGKKMNQSIAICRYLGRELKIAGSNNWESLEIDAIVDTIQDLRQKISGIFFEKDEAVKAEKIKVALTETFPFFLEKLDKIAKENKGYLALSKLTWADLFFVSGLETLSFFAKKDLIADYPNLLQVKTNVCCLPAIKNWIAKRPKTEY